MTQKEIELILLRQCASYLPMPIWLMDPNGELLYYNEPAEPILGQRFDEAGPMPGEKLSAMFLTTAEDGSALDASDLPINMRDLRCSLTLHDVPRGRFEIGGPEIMSDLVCHPGPTVGYRITEGAGSIAYLPDHEPALGARHFPEDPDCTSGFELASGVDILIHDAQYTAEEYADRIGWGHSSIPHALAFATVAHVGTLVTFHHDPTHCDALLDELIEEARRTPGLNFELAPGAEGASFQLGV